MATAPVCNNAPAQSPGQPDPKMLPTIPPATDLQSALDAINAIRRILQTMINFPGMSGGGGGHPGAPQVKKGRGFKEIRQARVTRRVRIYNPQDKSQYVDVDQIVGMVLQDPITGQTWQWQQ